MTSDIPFQEAFARLKVQFLKGAEKDCATILELLDRPQLDVQELIQLRFLVHSLVGTAPMFEHPELGQVASAVEQAIYEATVAERGLTEAEQAELRVAAGHFAACHGRVFSG
ncbi:Hpt domain-containing protein [Marinibacterium profundimaris]|uniref:HPt domain-containing protein n=1 Tax=Marinibacterium profundimaris TaxID=1679460 RepID=A0A225NGS0_9RHOB|nr:Hpt domain-containing protein [Marinibacterium profundimaris]OWU72848.1 hypothetical protein ATO3_14185 [Marinibacterium profundimaris]